MHNSFHYHDIALNNFGEQRQQHLYLKLLPEYNHKE